MSDVEPTQVTSVVVGTSSWMVDETTFRRVVLVLLLISGLTLLPWTNILGN